MSGNDGSERRQAANGWLSRAQEFLDSARSDLEERRYTISCFLSHQAVELSLKGLLRWEGTERPEPTHQLVTLWEDAIAKSSSLRNMVGDLRSQLDMMEKYYIGGRYEIFITSMDGVPFDEYDEETAQQSVALATIVYKAIRKMVPA